MKILVGEDAGGRMLLGAQAGGKFAERDPVSAVTEGLRIGTTGYARVENAGGQVCRELRGGYLDHTGCRKARIGQLGDRRNRRWRDDLVGDCMHVQGRLFRSSTGSDNSSGFDLVQTLVTPVDIGEKHVTCKC